MKKAIAITRLRSLLSWGKGIGDDEQNEIRQIIKLLSDEN